MKKYDILNKIKENGLVAVIRAEDDIDAYEISKQVIAGGITTIELTFSTPYIENTIEKMSREYANDKKVLIGAGTVLDDITARIAILKGAKFIVSPNLDLSIAKLCNRYNIPYLPGCATVTQVVHAIEAGVDVIKLFPGGILGPGFIKDIKGPISYANIMPSGGVNLDNMDKWMDAGAFAIGIGSALTKDVKSKGYNSVKKETEKYYNKYISVKKI